MSDAWSFAEIDGQRVELLPARTVLSLFSLGDPGDVTVSAPNACSTAGNDGLLGLFGGTSASCAQGSTVVTN